MPITVGYKELVAQATLLVKTYRVDDVKLQREIPSIQLIDIRDIRELSEGTIVGAYHAPRCMLEFWVDPESPYHKPLFADESKEFILFCNLGWRSALAAKTLQDMGMTNVAHMEGGYAEWVNQGGPTETLEAQKARRHKPV